MTHRPSMRLGFLMLRYYLTDPDVLEMLDNLEASWEADLDELAAARRMIFDPVVQLQTAAEKACLN